MIPTSSTDEPGDDLEGRERLLAHVDFHGALIETPSAQLLAEPLARVLCRVAQARGRGVHDVHVRGGRQQQVEQPLLRVLPRLGPHVVEPLLAHHVDRQLHEVTDHRLDIAADVPDLGELRCLHLDERRLREPREAPGDLGLADTGRADHEDVLRRDLLGELRRQLLTPRAVAERDGDGAFGVVLSDHVLVELRHDLPWRQRVCRERACAREGKSASAQSSSTHDIGVRVDADVGRDRHRLLCDRARVERAVARERPGGCHRERAAGPDAHDPVVGLDEVAGAGEQEQLLAVHHDEHRLEPAQGAIGAPVLRELDGRALELSAVLFELRFEPGEEREGIGGRTGEPGDNSVVIELPDLARVVLHHGLAERDLAIAGHHGAIVEPQGENCRYCET